MLSLNNEYPRSGKVEWIGLRPDRNVPQKVVETVTAKVGEGLVGDRYTGKNGKRDVTLIQNEHLSIVGDLLDTSPIDPSKVRRNIVVSGINLVSLKEKNILIGDVHLEVTGSCAPCSKMESNLGAGGYNAMRGHGGITARITKSGTISVGDSLVVISSSKVENHESY